MTSLSPAAGTGRGAGGPHQYAHLIGRLQLSPHSLKHRWKESKSLTHYQTASAPLHKAERYDNMYCIMYLVIYMVECHIYHCKIQLLFFKYLTKQKTKSYTTTEKFGDSKIGNTLF